MCPGGRGATQAPTEWRPRPHLVADGAHTYLPRLLMARNIGPRKHFVSGAMTQLHNHVTAELLPGAFK